MAFAYPLTGLVTIFVLVVYFWMALQVGRARQRFEVPAPHMEGPEEFLRVLRVQGNTTEGLALFLPALWLFALTIGDQWAALVGLFYPLGRIVYARGYYREALKRSTGFTIGILSTVVLIIGALIGLAMTLAGIAI